MLPDINRSKRGILLPEDERPIVTAGLPVQQSKRLKEPVSSEPPTHRAELYYP
jgi:hypothetical protein